MADDIILTIDATKIATTEKNGAAAACAGNERFLPQMGSNTGNHRKHAHAAYAAAFVFGAGGIAGSRA